MKKLNYKKAYEILKLPIIQGIKHSDLYYLFGEVNRILKTIDKNDNGEIDYSGKITPPNPSYPKPFKRMGDGNDRLKTFTI